MGQMVPATALAGNDAVGLVMSTRQSLSFVYASRSLKVNLF